MNCADVPTCARFLFENGLTNLATAGQKTGVARLMQRVEADALVAERMWLREQVGEISR